MEWPLLDLPFETCGAMSKNGWNLPHLSSSILMNMLEENWENMEHWEGNKNPFFFLGNLPCISSMYHLLAIYFWEPAKFPKEAESDDSAFHKIHNFVRWWKQFKKPTLQTGDPKDRRYRRGSSHQKPTPFFGIAQSQKPKLQKKKWQRQWSWTERRPQFADSFYMYRWFQLVHPAKYWPGQKLEEKKCYHLLPHDLLIM